MCVVLAFYSNYLFDSNHMFDQIRVFEMLPSAKISRFGFLLKDVIYQNLLNLIIFG
jgi:hypothetical protein